MNTLPRPPIYRIVFVQLSLCCLVGLIALLHSVVAAKSAVLGGLAAALPNAYFIVSAFRYRGAVDAQKMARAMVQGMAWKFMLTALMFAVFFSQGWNLDFLALFAGFVTVQLGQMFSGKIANL